MDEGTTFSGFLEGLYDTARGVFKTVADIELGRTELELEKERRKAEARRLRNNLTAVTASELGGVQTVTQGEAASSGKLFGLSPNMLLMAGLGLAALVLIAAQGK